MPTILIVDDEPQFLACLESILSREYLVLTAFTGTSAVEACFSRQPDLLLIDVVLPDKSGLEVCHELREAGIRIPVLLMSARRVEEIDSVRGLKLGADDYLIKPFGSELLLAHVETRLRRSAKHPAHVIPVQSGSVQIDLSESRVSVRGNPVELTSKEFSLLRYLALHIGQVVSRAALLKEVWGYEASAYSRTIDTHVFMLRKKLEKDPASPRLIVSERGGGYRLTA